MRFARILAIGIAVLLLFPAISAPAYASTPAHGCAPTTPPTVPGSLVTPPATPGIVVINEILNNPDSTWNCAEPAGSFTLTTDSWVELYNPQNQPFNLYAARASFDDGSGTFTFHFPFGAAIAARGYFVVFPDSYTGMLNGGNNLQLTFGGTIIDQVSTPALPADNTYARIPDGSANWQITNNPTIDASNLPSMPVTSTPVTTTTTGGSGSGSTSSGNTTPTPVTGKQPGWEKLQLPAADSAATPTTNSPLAAASPKASAWDVTRRILLTVLIVALALSLFWCWKLFSSA
ncbi:MAG TPA: lamin tail domain-containing protein [Ktedonobacteraceae bacterium]